LGQFGPGAAPEVEVFQRAYQFLSDVRLDGIGDTLEAIRGRALGGRAAAALDRARVRSEPDRVHVAPLEGLEAADAMILFRSAVKAICARRGLLASFMCAPALPSGSGARWSITHMRSCGRTAG
jgi:glutamine synthetase